MAYIDSAWGYASTGLTDPTIGVSEWGYALATLVDPGKPNLMIGGQETDINWRVMKNGSPLPVLRWAIISAGVESPLSSSHAVEWTPPQFTVGADAVGTMSYPIPTGEVYYVATNGNNGNAGTSAAAPLATLAAAIGKVSAAGATIVVRGGTYHEGEIEVLGSKPAFTIQNYPGEAVWFDGATVLSGWTNNGNGTWSAPYALTYDRNLGKGANIATWSGAVTRTIVDQVWLDTTRLTPVADATTPGAGQFSVNQSTHILTIGSDPTGKTTRVVDLKYLLAGTTVNVKGIGIRRYAQAMVEYRGSALAVGTGSIIEQVTIEHCSVDALSIGGAGITIRRCTFQDTGHSGVMGDNAGGLVFEQNIIRRCNRADYDAEPTTAGFKMTRTFAGVTIRHNLIQDIADGAGIWFDTTVSRSKVINNTIIGTSALGTTGYRMKNGIEIEGSDGGYYDGSQHYTYVVGNRVSDCRQAGLVLFDSGWVKVWNNSLSAAVALYLWQDYRQNDGSKPSTEGTIAQSPWHTVHVDIVNNALVPEGAYYTQLRGQCNSDAVFKIAGGAMIDRLHSNWFRPAGSGLMAYLSNAAGSTYSTRQTLAALEATTSDYGGPLNSIMSGNYQGDTAPTSSGVSIEADVAAASGIPLGFTPAIGPIWPELANS